MRQVKTVPGLPKGFSFVIHSFHLLTQKDLPKSIS